MPSEWHEQTFVQMVFPHSKSDWNCCLEEASKNFEQIISTIAKYQPCLVVCDDITRVKSFFKETHNIHFVQEETDDTWSRDISAITIIEDELTLLDFRFNGWGDKFDASKDNSLNKRLLQHNFYQNIAMRSIDFILEGGSIESDGDGVLLTTEKCLLNDNRNNNYSKVEIEDKLKKYLQIKKVLWLKHGELEGDDTDAHIDTLARFAPNNTIIYVDCNEKMKKELESFTNIENEAYKLLALPHVEYLFENKKLPATYANFLIINGAVLVPTYAQDTDQEALHIIKQAFPDREVIGIDCQTLIKQHGSLHCVTMQMYH